MTWWLVRSAHKYLWLSYSMNQKANAMPAWFLSKTLHMVGKQWICFKLMFNKKTCELFSYVFTTKSISRVSYSDHPCVLSSTSFKYLNSKFNDTYRSETVLGNSWSLHVTSTILWCSQDDALMKYTQCKKIFRLDIRVWRFTRKWRFTFLWVFK